MSGRSDMIDGDRRPVDEQSEREAHRLFRLSLDEPPDRRAEFVQRACAGREQVQRRVERLLASMENADEFLETPAVAALGGAPQLVELDGGLVGARIGRYRVLSQIAAGGMGVVYLAEQESPRRTVALKVMRLGLSSRRAHRLFEHEAQILGRLQHPNIARIFEASTHVGDGHATPIPYFAMEYLAGAEPLTVYCRTHALDVATRLALFRKACLGVHHGHQKGIVHRDLKPANIIVDASGEPKVIDYGVALATSVDPEASRAHSDAGQFVGTLRYMSPEQCRGDLQRIDTRSDVYALGVVLYELLCDRFPLDLEEVSPLELPRVVSERAPIRPRVAAPDLPRDLETIILKAMAKEPEERYQSVVELERDLGRFLHHQPIEAQPASALYLSRLFVRRHRTLIASGLFAAVAGLVAIAVSVGFALAAREAERRANEDRDLAVHRQYFADMAAAEAALRAQEFGRLRTHLRSAPPVHRGWEWRHLLQRSEPSLLVVERPAIVDSVACTPDGEFMLAGSRNGVVGIWPLGERTPCGELRVPGTLVLDLAISPDGSLVAATTDRGSVELFELDSQRHLWSSDGGHGDIGSGAQPGGERDTRAVAFAPDGQSVYSVGLDGSICAWDVRDGARRWSAAIDFGSSLPGILALSPHPFDPIIAVGGPEGRIELRSSESGAFVGTLAGHPGDRIVSLAHSRDGTTLYSGATDRTIGVWNLATGERQRTLFGHDRSVWSLAVSEDGLLLASASVDHTLRLWSTVDGTPRGVFHGHGDTVADVAWMRGDTRLVTASWDRTFRLWDPTLQDEPIAPRAVGEVIDHIACGGDGRLIATAHSGRQGVLGGAVLLRDASTLGIVGTIERLSHRPRCCEFSPDGGLLAIGWSDGVVTLDDARTGERCWSVAAHEGQVLSMCFTPDGTQLATGGRESSARMWDVETGVLRREFPGASRSVGVIAVSSDGARLATAASDGVAQLWDLGSGSEVATLIGHLHAIYCVTFSPDGRSLLTGSRDQTIRVWDAGTGTLERTLDGHGQWVTGLAYSPDGSRLASTSWFETLTLWDAERLEPIVSLRGHDRPVRSLAIVPGGDRIVTGDDAGTIRIWDSRPREQRTLAEVSALEDAAWAEVWIAAASRAGEIDAERLTERIQDDAALTPGQRHAALNALLRRGLGRATGQ